MFSVLLPFVLLGVPQGSLLLDAPSPKGSADGEESAGGAGAPQASSALTGAEAGAPHGSLSVWDASPNGSELFTGDVALAPFPQASALGADGASQGSALLAGGELAVAPHVSMLSFGESTGGALKGSDASSFGGVDVTVNGSSLGGVVGPVKESS